jgi:Tol biopolymer transport system component
MTAAAMLAICLLALVETTNTAQAEDYLPENGKIAFTSSDGSSPSIYTVKPSGSNPKKLISGYNPNWSPDGTAIVFAEPDRGQISVVSVDGSNVGTFHKIEGALAWDPKWLPDGTKVAFHQYANSEDIYVVDLASSSQTNLTKTPGFDENYPDFSPNGSQICYFRYVRGKSVPGIYVMDADGSDPTLLFEYHTSSPEQCAWSPDGKMVALPSFGMRGDLEVYVINADGSGRTALTRNSALDRAPAWSPDGTRIAFSSDRDGDLDIYTMDADGSDVAQVTNLPGDEDSPDWQPLNAKNPSATVNPPDTGGPSLLLVAIALLFSMSYLLYAVVRPRM